MIKSSTANQNPPGFNKFEPLKQQMTELHIMKKNTNIVICAGVDANTVIILGMFFFFFFSV